jgi:hypothetical protein
MGAIMIKHVLAIVIVFSFSCMFVSQAKAEILTDRCSNEVAYSPTYDAKVPLAKGAIVLKRGKDGWSPWSEPFEVKTGDDGFIRWWCHSTIGDEFDPGTWRVGVNAGGIIACASAVGVTVLSDGTGAPSLAGCAKVVTLKSSAVNGWTPERSRCSAHSNRIRARLGPDRLLQTECLKN